MINGVSQAQSVLCVHTKKRKMCKYMKVLCLLSQHASAQGAFPPDPYRGSAHNPAGGLSPPDLLSPQSPTAGDATGQHQDCGEVATSVQWNGMKQKDNDSNHAITKRLHNDRPSALWPLLTAQKCSHDFKAYKYN